MRRKKVQVRHGIVKRITIPFQGGRLEMILTYDPNAISDVTRESIKTLIETINFIENDTTKSD